MDGRFCRQCGKDISKQAPNERFCPRRCFRAWYIANVNPEWVPVTKRKRLTNPFFADGFEDVPEDAAQRA